ncbi:MAG: VOC family protein [Gemmatimonadaceae bacterium]
MTEEALKARGLEPSLTVNDVDQSIRFYRDGLGFNVKEEMKGDDGKVLGARFEAGNARLGISQDDFSKGRDRAKGIGVRLMDRN